MSSVADHTAPTERLSAALASLPASAELREAALAEILIEQMKVIDAQRHVIELMDTTDRQLTTTVQALRDEINTFTKLIGQASQAFLGELAVRAADQARKTVADTVTEELIRLRRTIETRDAHGPGLAAAPRSVPMNRAIAIGVGTLAVIGATSLALLAAMQLAPLIFHPH
jgi:hypothetical protein